MGSKFFLTVRLRFLIVPIVSSGVTAAASPDSVWGGWETNHGELVWNYSIENINIKVKVKRRISFFSCCARCPYSFMLLAVGSRPVSAAAPDSASKGFPMMGANMPSWWCMEVHGHIDVQCKNMVTRRPTGSTRYGTISYTHIRMLCDSLFPWDKVDFLVWQTDILHVLVAANFGR